MAGPGAELPPSVLDLLARRVPGYHGYASRQRRRGSDHLVRMATARALAEAGRLVVRAPADENPVFAEANARAHYHLRYAAEQAGARIPSLDAFPEEAAELAPVVAWLEETDRQMLDAADAAVQLAASLTSSASGERVRAVQELVRLADSIVLILQGRLTPPERASSAGAREPDARAILGDGTPWPPPVGTRLQVGPRWLEVREVCAYEGERERWVVARGESAEGPAQLEDWPGAGPDRLALLAPLKLPVASPLPPAIVWGDEHYHRTTEGMARVICGSGLPATEAVRYWRFEAFSGRRLRLESGPRGALTLFGELVPLASIGVARGAGP